MGKSRTIGWTSAEYERPVNLRQRRSWIPPRKSRASRIIGEREVRSMAASTSASADASVPSTISSRTGSTTSEEQVPVLVHGRRQARIDDRGRARFLDDGWPTESIERLEQVTLVDGCLGT